MRRFSTLLTCAALAAGSSAAAASPFGSNDKDLVATAAAAGTFETLLAALRAAGLEDALRSEGPFTVFAPTDAAFAALPEGALAELLQPSARERLATILRYHVIPGRIDAAAAVAAGSATTLAGDALRIRLVAGQLTVDDAKVVSNDIATTNGVIHAIDAVLMPPDAATAPPLQLSSAGLIQLAIDRGVPLFNAGQQAACAAIYELAACSLLAHSEPALADDVRRLLDTAVRGRGARVGAAERAWGLRQALDAAYLSLRSDGEPAAVPTATPTAAATVVDDFDDARSSEPWRVVNDTVMGGRSSSSLTADGQGSALFAGDVSLENNGGFASVRRRVSEGSMVGYAGIVLRVRGDGNVYRFNVSNRGEVTGDLYRAEFVTENGEWIELRLPFAEMARSVMGFRPPNAAPIDPARIRSIGISIGDKQEGPFQLEIDWIRAYRPAR